MGKRKQLSQVNWITLARRGQGARENVRARALSSVAVGPDGQLAYANYLLLYLAQGFSSEYLLSLLAVHNQ